MHCIVQYRIVHYIVQEPFDKNFAKVPNEAIPKARRSGSREAIVEAAERLYLRRGFGSVSMRL